MSGKNVDQYRQIHESKSYGATSVRNFRHLAAQASTLPVTSIVDFGCGQSVLVDHLAEYLGASAARYDPAIPAFEEKPEGQFDLLLNTDVLEHIPETEIDGLLAEMRAMAKNALFIIDLRLAKEILPNGDNAHCSLFPAAWWQEKVASHFGKAEPISVRHAGRAAFRTWSLGPSGRLRCAKTRMALEWDKISKREIPRLFGK